LSPLHENEIPRTYYSSPPKEKHLGVFVSSLPNLFLGYHSLKHKDENFIPRYIEKRCLFNIIIFPGTIKIDIIISNYI